MSQIVFVDLETTGLDPLKHGIIEIAAIFTLDGISMGRESWVVDPGEVEITEEALDINGYTPERIRQGIPLATALGELNQAVKPNAILAGWNVGFDYGFLKSAYSACNLPFPFGYHCLDIQSVFRFMKLCNRYNGAVSLEKAAIACRIAHKDQRPHRAIIDVYWTYQLFVWAQERMG